MLYLDHNATTKPAEPVVAVMREALEEGWHNPSSTYRAGQRVRHRIDLARQSVAELLGCRDREVVFTSGGTEADNVALFGAVDARPDRPVIATNRLEHAAIRESAETLQQRGKEIVWLPVDGRGLIDLDALDELLARRADEIAIVSVMWANNETGIIQPVEAIGARCHDHGVWFHTDAVQWVGKMPTNASALPLDLLSFSGHKFHGPKGAGGLYVRTGMRLPGRVVGGGQERHRRGGTENVPGVLGLGAAATLATEWLATDERERLGGLRDDFERRLRALGDDVVVNGADAPRMWNTTNVGFRRLEAEAILLLLSEREICVSAGAACASGSLEPSPILLAMGVEEAVAHGSIRVSLCRETTAAEIETALEAIPAVIERLRASLPV